MNREFYSKVALIALFSSLISFYLRLNYEPFFRILGTYQGDIWYFYHQYGKSISNNFFFLEEYPVGFIIIQKFAWFITKLFNSFYYQDFLAANALFIIPISVATYLLSIKLAEFIGNPTKKALLYLLSPTFFIAQSTNYDLLSTFSSVLALFLLFRKKYLLSSIFLSLGAVVKIYPIFLLPLFALYSKDPWRYIAYFILTFSLINLPFYLYNPAFWLFPYLYQLHNPQSLDHNTLSFYLHKNLLPIFLLIGYTVSFKFSKKNALTDKKFSFLVFFILFSILIGYQVNTPQYLLWVIPFAAIIQPPLLLWLLLDLSNSSILYFYFKLHSEWNMLLLPIFTFNLFCLSLIYIYLFKKAFNYLK